MGVHCSQQRGYGCQPGVPSLHLLLSFHLLSSHPTSFHSSPLFRGLIHTFPGTFYHCHFFPLALDPQQRNESVNWRGLGRGAGVADGCSGGAKPGLIHHRRRQSAWAAAGPPLPFTEGSACEGLSRNCNCWRRGGIFHC